MRYRALIILCTLALLAAAIGPSARAAPAQSLTDSLIAYWKLDEIASSMRYDSYGSNNLTKFGTISQSPGKINYSAGFSGSAANYLYHADSADLSTGAGVSFTLAGWFKIASKAGTEEGLITKYQWPSHGWEYGLVYRTTTDRFRLWVGDGTNYYSVDANTFGSPSTGTWYYVVGWLDNANNQIHIQVNNGTIDSAAMSVDPYDGTGGFDIGVLDNGSGPLNGYADEVGFWKRVLTTDERTALYNSGIGCSYMFSLCPASAIPVWQIGNYLLDGSLETWPYVLVPPWWPWNSEPFQQNYSTVERQLLWTHGGELQPACDNYFAEFNAVLNAPSTLGQQFYWYGGDMFLTFALRTQPNISVNVELTDPFGVTHNIATGLTNTTDDWQAFNYTVDDQWLGLYRLYFYTSNSTSSKAYAAIDAVSISEGWWQPCTYRVTVTDEPDAAPYSFTERTQEAQQETAGDNLVFNSDFSKIDGVLNNWNLIVSGAAFVPFLNSSDGYLALFSGVENAVQSKNWIEVMYNTPVMPKGFDLAKATSTLSHTLFVSYIISDMQQKVVSFYNIETGETIAWGSGQLDLQEQIPGTNLYRLKHQIDIPPGRYRLSFGFAGTGTGQIVYLDKVCVGGGGYVVASDCDLSESELIQYQLDANFRQQQITSAEATAVAVSTGTAMAISTATQSSLMTSTAAAQVYATQTALVASGNVTRQYQATTTHVAQMTATPRAALTSTAFVAQFRGTLTAQAANVQTQAVQSQMTATAMANAAQTRVAIATQQAQMQATAWAQSTVAGQMTQQAAGQATLVVGATTTVEYQPTVNTYATSSKATQNSAATQYAAATNATNAYLATLSAQQVGTAQALMTQAANAQATTSALLTAYPGQQATIEAQATEIADQYATALATLQYAATQQVLVQPPTQPEPVSGLDCTRPDNPLNIAWWIDYEVCRFFDWTSWSSTNTQQITDLQTDIGSKEPFGTMQQTSDMAGQMRDLIGSISWPDASCTSANPDPEKFLGAARGLLLGEIDINNAGDEYEFSTDCNLDQTAVIVGPYIAEGMCLAINILCMTGLMPWFQWLVNIIVLVAFVLYVKTAWIDKAVV